MPTPCACRSFQARTPLRVASMACLLLCLVLVWGCTPSRDTLDVGQPVPRPRLGLKVKVVHGDEFMDEVPDDRDRVLLVMTVDATGPAGQAGVRPGDILLRIDDKPVQGMRDSYALLRRKRPGQEIVLDIWRNEEILKLGMEVSAPPAQE